MQVRCVKQSTQSRCSRTTQRDGVGGGRGGGVRMVAHLHPWLIHVNVWQGPPQCCDMTVLQLKKKKGSTWQCKRHRFNPWVRKISWSRKWQPTLVFLPWESHGQKSPVGYGLWGWTRLSLHTHTLRCANVRPPGYVQGLKINQFHDGKCHWESSL